jgi:uncharacterized membrane protein
MTKTLTWSLWGLAALLSAAIALFSYRYLPAIGPLSPNVLRNLFHKPWLDIHIAGAATALLVGPVQFIPWIRARHRRLHRWLGRTYVVGCLVGGVGGFIMAFGSTAGPIATGGFASLAVMWIITNVQGWRMARERQFEAHRAWMIRSFALTFAAVTLRLYLPFPPMAGIPFVEGYRAISYLCWIPNLLVAELYIRGVFSRQPATVQV